MSGIVTLSLGDEPLNDGDPFDCLFDYDGSGNNTVDFGFLNTNSTCFADLNNDNIITVADLLMVLSEFGCIVNCENTDVNNDDVTTVIDLLAILSVFGTVCE
jgi:hypothetical protein